MCAPVYYNISRILYARKVSKRKPEKSPVRNITIIIHIINVYEDGVFRK